MSIQSVITMVTDEDEHFWYADFKHCWDTLLDVLFHIAWLLARIFFADARKDNDVQVSKSDALSVGTIVGICFGVALLLVVIFDAVRICHRKRKIQGYTTDLQQPLAPVFQGNPVVGQLSPISVINTPRDR